MYVLRVLNWDLLSAIIGYLKINNMPFRVTNIILKTPHTLSVIKPLQHLKMAYWMTDRNV